MVSPEHVDNMPDDEQALSSAEKKQPQPVLSRRWVRVLMSIVGAVLPFVGGFLFGWLGYYAIPANEDSTAWSQNFLLSVSILLLFAFVGALLLRSWWALLIVPVVASVGLIMGDLVVPPLMQGGWPAVQAMFVWFFSGIQNDVMLYAIWFLSLLGTTAIGSVIDKQLQMRLLHDYTL